MPRTSDLPYLRDLARRYKLAVAIPAIVSPTLAGIAMYAIARGLLREIPDNAPVVWMLAGMAFWSDKVLNMIAVDRWQGFEAMAREAQPVKPRERWIVHTRNEKGDLVSGEFASEVRLLDVENSELAKVCHAVVKAGKLSHAAVESVSTRKVYKRLRDEMIRCGYARWKSEASHKQGVVITDIGWEWFRRKARAYSPTGLVRA